MSVRQDGKILYLEGDCPIEQAETLAALLDAHKGLIVDLSGCRSAHSAIIQALLRFRPPLRGAPDSHFLKTLILPSLGGDASDG